MHSGRKPSLLMVEDNPNTRDIFEDIFTKSGFEVTILPDADGAFIDLVAKYDPDIISMDLMIGRHGKPTERDGFDAISALKADVRTAHIPVIVLTNFFQEKRVRRAKELGAVDYINLAAHDLHAVAKRYLLYLFSPAKYKPTHPVFREKQ